MSSLEIHVGDRHRVYQILEDQLTIGSHASNQVRLRGDGIDGCHVRVTRTDEGFRLEDLDSRGGIKVNGASLSTHELSHGDEIEIGDAVLVYVEADKPRPIRPATLARRRHTRAEPEAEAPTNGGVVVAPIPSAPARGRARRGRAASRQERPLRRRRGPPQWFIVSTAVLFVIAVVGIGLRWSSQWKADQGPEALVELAEHQSSRGDYEAALGSLDAAEQAGPDARVANRITRMRGELQASMQSRTDRTRLERARARFNEIDRFVKQYLDDGASRPEARELVRLTTRWLDDFGEMVQKYPLEADRGNRVAEFRSAAAPTAVMSEPDAADDVIFSASRRPRFKRPRYREALEILDEWLRANPLGNGADRVRETRQEFVADGQAWVKRQIRSAETAAGSGDERRIEFALDKLQDVTENAPPEWAPELPALIETLQRTLDGLR